MAGLEAAGLQVETVRENRAYRFISERAIEACHKYRGDERLGARAQAG